MRKTIQKFAYRLCSTEVKMLIDKLEENSSRIGLTVLGKELRPSHGFLHITNTGKFSIVERIAIASKLNEIHRKATKLAIVETIFEGERKQERTTGKLITTTDVTAQALKIIESEMSNVYNTAAIKNPTQTAEALRQKGLL